MIIPSNGSSTFFSRICALELVLTLKQLDSCCNGETDPGALFCECFLMMPHPMLSFFLVMWLDFVVLLTVKSDLLRCLSFLLDTYTYRLRHLIKVSKRSLKVEKKTQ